MRGFARRRLTGVVCLAILAAGACSARAGEWAQWRGPERNSLVRSSPPLVDGFPEDGPKRLWTSKELLGDHMGGFGGISVAQGKAYVFCNAKVAVRGEVRSILHSAMRKLGHTTPLLTVSEDVLAAVKKVRLSDELAAIEGSERKKWAREWTEQNAAKIGFVGKERAIELMLRLGRDMIDEEKLIHIGRLTHRDKHFENQEALIAWLKEEGLNEADIEKILSVVPSTHYTSKDRLYCLDVADGSTLWTYEADGPDIALKYPCSSTPTIVDGRCYVQGSDGWVFCLDAGTGREIWRVRSEARRDRDAAGSFAVHEGVAIVLAGSLMGFDAGTGRVLWTQPKVNGQYASPAIYRTGGRAYAICNGSKQTLCVDAKTGEVIWTMPGGGNCTPTIVDDWMVLTHAKNKSGLSAYKLSATEATKAWEAPFLDPGTSALIHRGVVFAMGGQARSTAACVELATGSVLWKEKMKDRAEYSSPIGVHDKIINVVGKHLYMIKSDRTALTVLGRAKLNPVRCTSPTLVDGILYLRHSKYIAAYDLRAGQDRHD